jgi:hypothetical protein
MSRFANSALALLISFCASSAAHAQFPICDPAVNNPELNPPYPSDPAIPFSGSHTKWSVDQLAINLSIDEAAPTQFHINGVNYEPTQIGGSADFSPFNDFFYTNNVNTWNPLWPRDIPLLRAMGVNTIRTYGMWKWEPGFAQAASGAPDGVATFWNLLNFDASKASENNNQFCFPPSDTSIYAFQHPTHADFLDLLWNNGVNPIYLWIGVSLPLELVDPNVPETCSPGVVCKADFRQFYRYTAKWLAKKYGDHPAVMGFVVGNELDTRATTPTSNFWQTINDIGAVIKASAPDKLTAFTFHDTPDYNRTITDAPFMNLRGPQVYSLDVYGFNPYTNPLPPGNLFDRFRTNVVQNCTQNGTSNPCVKPLMYGEFGTPADMHKVTAKPYPVPWTAENFVWKPSPPPPSCLASGAQPPPGGGGDGPAAEAASGATIAEELPTGAYYTMPATLAPFFPSSKTGAALPAAAQADWIAYFLDVSNAKKANNNAPPAEFEFNSGGFMFEWRDEWWKANPVPTFHSVTGNQTCTGCSSSGPMPTNCDTGAANPVFPGGWGDEEWFGAVGAVANGRKNTDPVVNSDTGMLNGGPDTLTPRAALVALCRAYLSPKTCE